MGIASPLKRLTLALDDKDLAIRQYFAAVALSTMAQAYEDEMEQVLLDRQTARRHGAWLGLVRRYTDRMWLQVEAASGDTTIDIDFTVNDEMAITLDGETTIIAAIRFEQQSQMEQEIIDAFCQIHDCVQWVNSAVIPEVGVLQARAKVSWSFDEDGVVLCQSSAGLQLQFTSMKNMANKRRFCDAYMAEMQQLLQHLQRLHSQSARLNWQGFQLQAVRDGLRHQLAVNKHGDVLWLELPISYALPALFEQSLPWLQAMLAGRDAQVRIDLQSMQVPLQQLLKTL